MAKERKLKLHEQPGLVFRAMWLTKVCTDTLLLYLASPSSQETRTLRSLILAEVLYRLNPRDPDKCAPLIAGMRDPQMYREAWQSIFGNAPIPPGWGAPSECFRHDRAWARLDLDPESKFEGRVQ
jgi:hypothetical protein